MGKAKYLHENEFGYALRCGCTGAIHVGFGNVALRTNAVEFSVFRKYVADAYQHYRERVQCPVTDVIMLRTPTDNMALVFNLLELEKLWEITESTAVMLEIDQVLNTDSPNEDTQ